MGADGVQLLTALYAAEAPSWLHNLPAVEVLRRVWVQQFSVVAEVVRWRAAEDLPPSSLMICSPYDAEARYSQKRQTEWTGYKVHLTETCDEDTPHVITDVQTTPAPRSDYDLLPTIQTALATRELLPAEQLVDTGYVSAEHIVTSQREHQVTVLGPVNPDSSWQAKAHQGFDVAAFGIDWETHTATCPQGRQSSLWMPGHDRHDHTVINIRFARNECQACPMRERCTHSPTEPRMLTVRPQVYHEAFKPHVNTKLRWSLNLLMRREPASKARSHKAFASAIFGGRVTLA